MLMYSPRAERPFGVERLFLADPLIRKLDREVLDRLGVGGLVEVLLAKAKRTRLLS